MLATHQRKLLMVS